MNLFKKRKKIDELDYNLINEYHESCCQQYYYLPINRHNRFYCFQSYRS